MQEIIESLNGLGYQGDCLQESVINEVLDNGLATKSFRTLINWLTSELGVLLNLDEQIHPDSEATEFALELSSLLKELSCPYTVLISGQTAQRFQTRADRLLLLNYLITELMAAKMSHKLNPKKKVVIEIIESPAAVALKSITQNLNLGKPPQNITPKAYFEKLLNRFTEVYKKNEQIWGKALFIPSKSLTFEEWKKIDKLQSDLDDEYDLRRDMLLTRLDVTIQSFQWSDAAKNKCDEIAERYASKRSELERLLHQNKATDIVELLAARDELLLIEKTSSSNVRKKTQTDLQKHIIGMVPDRGGRGLEHQRPPPEMPAWQKNRNQGGGGGGGSRGGRGGGNQNYYQNQNPQQQRNYQSNYQQQGNNYQQGNYQHGYQNSGKYSGNNSQNQYSDNGNNYQQNKSYNNSNRGGNNRVQGGWSQSGTANRGSGGSGGGGGGGAGNYREYGNQNQQRSHDYSRGDGYQRGQSNYNRGGRR